MVEFGSGRNWPREQFKRESMGEHEALCAGKADLTVAGAARGSIP